MLRIALIPLDERPVNTRLPQMLGEIGGAEVLLPPHGFLGRQREPADRDVIGSWLREQANGEADAAAVSCDFLGYGNLINARISDESAATVLARLSLLEEIGAKIPVHAFSLITRVSNADDNREEPTYWDQWGTKFYSYARLTHRKEKAGDLTGAEQEQLDFLTASLPGDLVADWTIRRLRNHSVNLALVDLAARGKVASLLLTSDDTAAYGFPTRERDWIHRWIELIGPEAGENVRMHPGADEVGSALVAKLINREAATQPRVWIDYATEGDEELVAPYEDRPVRETVLGQIEACGCLKAESLEASDFILGVVTPSPNRADYRPEFLEADRAGRSPDYADFLNRLADFQRAGRPVALADVAYPNGSDPLFSEMLLNSSSPLHPGELIGYGAWNTAGNTLGVVVAQAACTLRIGGDPGRALAQKRFLAHRFLEDYGYQQIVRREARSLCFERWGNRDPSAVSNEQQSAALELINLRLATIMAELQEAGIGQGLRIAPGSMRLPWRRLFEVDFELI